MKPIYVLTLVTLLGHIPFFGARMDVSIFAPRLGASPVTVGLLAALFGLLPVLFSVAIGRWADRVGPRTPMLMGTAVVALALLAGLGLGNLAGLFAVSLAGGIGYNLFFVAQHQLIGRVGRPEELGIELRHHRAGLLRLRFHHTLHRRRPDRSCRSKKHLWLAGPDRRHGLPHGVAAAGYFRSPCAGRRQGNRGTGAKACHRPAAHAGTVAIHRGCHIAVDLGIPSRSSCRFTAARITSPRRRSAVCWASSPPSPWWCAFSCLLYRGACNPGSLLLISLAGSAITYFGIPLTASMPPLLALAAWLGIALGLAAPMLLVVVHRASPPERVGEAVGLRVTMMNASQTVISLVAGSLVAVSGHCRHVRDFRADFFLVPGA